jgi:hypothetical protein
MATPDFDALANAIVLATGRMADQSTLRPPTKTIVAALAADLAAAWPQDGPAHLPEWYAGYEAAMVDVARAETPPAPATLQHWTRDDGALVLSIKPTGDELAGHPLVVYLGDDVIADESAPPDGYACPDFTEDERHRHTIARTWEHAHEGGHEAHSAVSHDLSDAVGIEDASPAYIWPSPDGKGWVDAWNGWYATLAEALEDAPAGDGRLWWLQRGEGIISGDEVDARRARLVADGEEYAHLGGRA